MNDPSCRRYNAFDPRNAYEYSDRLLRCADVRAFRDLAWGGMARMEMKMQPVLHVEVTLWVPRAVL